MALTKCPDCGRAVSTKAETCPDCGRVLRRARPRNAFNPLHDPVHFIALLLIIFIVGVFIFGLAMTVIS